MSWRASALTFVLLALAPPVVAQPAAPVLTVDQAVGIALGGNRPLRIAALDVDRAQADEAALRTRKLPGLDVNALGSELLTPVDFLFPRGLFGSFAGTGPIPATDVALSTPRRPNTFLYATAGQPLSQLHRIGLGVQAGEAGVAMARERLRRRQQEVAADVRRLYYSLLQTRTAIDAADESIALYREIDRLTTDYVAQQTALRADLLDAKAGLARAEYSAISLRNGLSSQKEQLNTLLGRDVSTEFELAEASATGDALIADQGTRDAAQTKARADRPELREARLRVEQADLDRRSKRAEYIPDVSLTVTYLSPFNIEFVPKNIVLVGVSGKWEPFDWGRKARELASKTLAVEQAKAALAEAEAQVTADVNRRWRALQEARAFLAAASAARDASRERLRVTRERYATQAVLLKDLLQLQAAVADTSQSFEQALGGFWTARAEFERAIGEDVR
jgi:outer membrane protein